MARKRLGEILIESGLLNALQLAVALGEQNQWGGPLGSALIKKGFINAADLAHVLSKQLGIDWISLRDREIPEAAVKSLSVNLAKRYKVMPIALTDRTITVAMANPTDLKAVDSLAFATDKRIKPVLAIEAEIMMTIAKYYDKTWVEGQWFDQGYLARAVGGRDGKSTSAVRSAEILHNEKLDALIRLLIRKKIFTKREYLAELESGSGLGGVEKK